MCLHLFNLCICCISLYLPFSLMTKTIHLSVGNVLQRIITHNRSCNTTCHFLYIKRTCRAFKYQFIKKSWLTFRYKKKTGQIDLFFKLFKYFIGRHTPILNIINMQRVLLLGNYFDNFNYVLISFYYRGLFYLLL